ncbi:MAG TPA: hypothetical protein VEV81_04430 [Pyrinomonadaceae bacterium]|nr:hypothetical protein [Pyrinomonadaceae bacterium]
MLPQSDFVAFVNVKRLINEAAPKAFADDPAKLANFNAEIDKFKTQTGIDARSFENLAVGMRYQHPTPNITTTDTVVIASGTFNANAFIAAGRLAAPGKYEEEKYNGATIYVFNLQEPMKMLGLFNMKVGHVAATTLGSNTLVLGDPVSVRATLDASKLQSRGNNDLIQLATRTPGAFMGFGANVPPSLTAGADFGNAEITKIIGAIRQAYGAVGTTADGFEMVTIARTEKPDEAQNLSDTLSALKQVGGMMAGGLPADTGKLAQSALENLRIKSQGNETTIRLELKQADISTLMRVLQPKANPGR